MDLAQSLVRSCMRSFYDTRHILVIDALIIHSAVRDDDLAYLMGGMQIKELHKLCGRLKEDRFIAVHTRAEQKEGQTRPMNRTYYYIDYRATIDAIKWRVYLMNKNVQGNTIPEQERKEYFCRRCKSEWTQIEVLDKWDPTSGFLCHKCDFILDHDPDNNRGGHEQSTRYHAQFKFITDMLPKLDEIIIPENTFDKALAIAVKVIRDKTNPANETAPVDIAFSKPTAVKGMANTGPTSISVTLTKSEGPTEADIAADQVRKEKIAAQNAMPKHFTHSTITGEQVKFDAQSTFHTSGSNNTEKKPSVDLSNGDGAEIDDYFARLKAEQAREAEREQEEEDESDDDDEDDDEDGFEDVIPNDTGSAAATPASSRGDTKTAATTELPGVLKKRKSDSVMGSGSSTGVTSPVTGPNTPNEDGRATKKVRIEEPVAKVEEESEEEEFEDVQ